MATEMGRSEKECSSFARSATGACVCVFVCVEKDLHAME